MKERRVFVLISKDAMCCDYLHFYGNRAGQFPTPNMDQLIEKGTLFNKHYTAAPSTVMSFFSIATGKFAHETDFQMYERCHMRVNEETMFTKLANEGFDDIHCIWDQHWNLLFDYYDYFTGHVTVHDLPYLKESVGVHKHSDGQLFIDDAKALETFTKVKELFNDILNKQRNTFIWIHFPHVISGRACYGSDIDLFDKYVGMIRELVPDECIAITADHGNMNGHKGKLAYGFDVYESSARIPLITPRINNQIEVNYPTSSVDLYDILFKNNVCERELVYCDSAYRAQKHRKLAIIKGNYKYIYNKMYDTEELYDLEYDNNEEISIINEKLFDVDRKLNIPIREEYYYPKWDELPKIIQEFRDEKNRIWRNGDKSTVLKSNLKDLVRPLYDKYVRITNKN